MPKADLVIYNIGELVSFRNGPVARVTRENADIIHDAGIAVRDGKIVDVGSSGYIRARYDGLQLDAGGRLVTPGLVDAHTHLVFGGSREDEFELKLMGASYEEILRSGGGIYRTVEATRRASDEELIARALGVLDLMAEHGTTTVEIKSGYGLLPQDELRLLRLINNLADIHDIRIIPTLLAHVVPREYADRRQDYIEAFEGVIREAAAKGLAKYVDVFCDEGAFTVEETRRILVAAHRSGLRLRLHADELRYIGCSKLAAEFNLDSVDHLDVMPPENAKILAERGSVAMLLPTSMLAIFSPSRPPVEALREAGALIGVASDFNPNNMTPHVQLAMDLSTYLLGLTPLEALAAATINAAKSLALEDVTGRIAPGYSADIVVWDVENYRWIGYTWGVNKALVTIARGKIVYPEDALAGLRS